MGYIDCMSDWFKVEETGDELQTAIMTLKPGASSGPMSNEHAQSEQVLYVVSGEVTAEVGNRTWVMRSGDSTIVPRKVPHRFRNDGTEAAVTFNVYGPPAY